MKVRRWLAMALCAMAVATAGALASTAVWAQDAPQWKSQTLTDPNGAGTYTELRLVGTYLKPPTVVAAQPVLVIQCAGGKIQQNFFSFGAVLSQMAAGLHPVELEAYLDNVRRPIFSDQLSEDAMSAYFSRRDLKRILNAHSLRIGAVEMNGPQMMATFTMPDPEPIYQACGQDSVLKRR